MLLRKVSLSLFNYSLGIFIGEQKCLEIFIQMYACLLREMLPLAGFMQHKWCLKLRMMRMRFNLIYNSSVSSYARSWG